MTTDGNGNAHNGLTIREYFAAEAMKGLLANAGTWEMTEKQTAECSVLHADALIAALNKPKE